MTHLRPSFRYFEHEADIGIIGEGSSLDSAFEEGAKAMFNVMCDIKQVTPSKSIEISATAEKDDELFVEWLNQLLAAADMNDMMFSEFKITKLKNGILEGLAKGEKLKDKKHKLKTQVKAATYSNLEVGKKGDLFFAKCVVDV